MVLYIQCNVADYVAWLFKCGCYAEDYFGYQLQPNDRDDTN